MFFTIADSTIKKTFNKLERPDKRFTSLFRINTINNTWIHDDILQKNKHLIYSIYMYLYIAIGNKLLFFEKILQNKMICENSIVSNLLICAIEILLQ